MDASFSLDVRRAAGECFARDGGLGCRSPRSLRPRRRGSLSARKAAGEAPISTAVRPSTQCTQGAEIGPGERDREGYRHVSARCEQRTLEEDALRLECEGLADRQLKLRVESEVEITKLKSLLDTRRKDACKIALLTRKVDAIALALGSSPSASMAKYDGPRIDVGDQLTQLDVLAVEVTSVFSNGQFLQHADREFRDIQFHASGAEGVEVEFLMSWLLPFSVARVAIALWIQTTRMSRTERCSDFEDLYAGPGVLVSQFVVEPRIPGSFQSASGRPKGGPSHDQIATKLDESDGSVLLVSTFQSKVFKPNGDAKGFMKGDGLLRVEPVSDQMARVKWCRRVRGSPPELSSTTEQTRSRWFEELMKGPAGQFWQKNLESNVQEVENLLLTPLSPA